MDGLKLSYVRMFFPSNESHLRSHKLFMDGVWVSMMATDREFQNRGFGTAVIQDIKAYVRS